MAGPAPGLEECGDKAGGEPGRRAWTSGASRGGGEWGSDWVLRAWAAGGGGGLERGGDELVGRIPVGGSITVLCAKKSHEGTLAALSEIRHCNAAQFDEQVIIDAICVHVLEELEMRSIGGRDPCHALNQYGKSG